MAKLVKEAFHKKKGFDWVIFFLLFFFFNPKGGEICFLGVRTLFYFLWGTREKGSKCFFYGA